MERVTDRIQLIESLPKNMVMAELGVFEGAFSREILRICQPKELRLIDLWNKSAQSPDESHQAIKKLKRWDMWLTMLKVKFAHRKDPRVSVHRGFTTKVMAGFPDDHFDFVYIDASHKKEDVAADLEICRAKVRNGGYICGHDYQQVVNGVDTHEYDGLKQAVDEFCSRHGLAIAKLTQPGQSLTDQCLSYCIVNRKPA